MLDTNVVVSALIWGGVPYQLLEAAVAETVDLCTSPALLDELRDVLARPHLAGRLMQQQRLVSQAVDFYARLCLCAEPLHTPRVVPNDPDDDHVVAAAVQAQAQWIISGDKHLLELGGRIPIAVLTANQAVALISRQAMTRKA